MGFVSSFQQRRYEDLNRSTILSEKFSDSLPSHPKPETLNPTPRNKSRLEKPLGQQVRGKGLQGRVWSLGPWYGFRV